MKKKHIAHSIFFSVMLVILIAGLAVAKFYADEASGQPGYSGVDLLPAIGIALATVGFVGVLSILWFDITYFIWSRRNIFKTVCHLIFIVGTLYLLLFLFASSGLVAMPTDLYKPFKLIFGTRVLAIVIPSLVIGRILFFVYEIISYFISKRKVNDAI